MALYVYPILLVVVFGATIAGIIVWYAKREQKKRSTPGVRLGGDGLDDTYLFDFKNWSSQYSSNVMGDFGGTITVVGTAGGTHPVAAPMDLIGDINAGSGGEFPTHLQTKKIAIKPIDALKELETVPTPFTLTLIDEKIAIMKDK